MTLDLQFRSFAGACRSDGGTTYAAICESVADDPELIAIIAEAPLVQRRPNLLMAAVHDLLLRGEAHPLADYYDTVRTGECAVTLDGVGAVFRDFCLTRRETLAELVATRSTQTNEVGRCAILLPAFSAIAAQYGAGAAPSLLDLGTSAGLNLLFDRYGYLYRQRDDGSVRTAGDAASGVSLECTVRTPLDELPSLGVPAVADRVGLDLSPIDATSEDEARWLLACLWPDNLTRFNRLRAALDLWRHTPTRPRLVQGDMVDDLSTVAATVGDGGPLVIFHSWVAAYLTEERQRDLVDAVQQVRKTRPVHHLYAELPFETPGLPTPDGPEDGPRANAATALVHIGPDGAAPQRWGNVHPHGSWLRWFATPKVPTGHHGG